MQALVYSTQRRKDVKTREGFKFATVTVAGPFAPIDVMKQLLLLLCILCDLASLRQILRLTNAQRVAFATTVINLRSCPPVDHTE
jgi:hypothetical protein